MADIELVIKIPEEVKNRLCFWVTYPKDIQAVCEALNNGTPLPKGHGELKDVDVIDDNIYDLTRGMDLNYNQIIDVLDDVPTIIPADKESEIWNGYHGQTIQPKGMFDKIWNDAEENGGEI